MVGNKSPQHLDESARHCPVLEEKSKMASLVSHSVIHITLNAVSSANKAMFVHVDMVVSNQ
jgi:glycerol-3-phosphate responsive antiterminator